MRTQTTRTITGRVSGSDGIMVQPSEPGISSNRTGVGIYVIRLPTLVKLLAVAADSISGGVTAVSISNYTAQSFQVTGFTTTNGALTDVSFTFLATVAA